MRLASFITGNIEPILVEWEAFARSIWPPGLAATPAELRDSAAEILKAIVADMATSQSLHQQQEKSAGRGQHSTESDRLDHDSQVHGAGRVGSGLTLPAVVAEYRALRASVLRLWRRSRPDPDVHDLEDITRFNEAIDQSLALAVSSFTRRFEAARSLFLGILGHDIRNPLGAITLVAKLAKEQASPELSEQLSQIIESAASISHLVTDLLDYTRLTMGVSMPLQPHRADLHLLCGEAIRETKAAHGKTDIRLAVRGDVTGTWDGHRLRQVIVNLLRNAIQHGSSTHPVELVVDGMDAQTVVLMVKNQGEPIPPEVLASIFDPLVRGPKQHQESPGSVGLGLYIVREIASAHGGTAELASSAEEGTTATIRLPRHARNAQ